MDNVFYEACKTDDVDTVKSCLKIGYSDDKGLFIATENGHIEVLKILIKSERFITCLCDAIKLSKIAEEQGNPEIISLITNYRESHHDALMEEFMKAHGRDELADKKSRHHSNEISETAKMIDYITVALGTEGAYVKINDEKSLEKIYKLFKGEIIFKPTTEIECLYVGFYFKNISGKISE